MAGAQSPLCAPPSRCPTPQAAPERYSCSPFSSPPLIGHCREPYAITWPLPARGTPRGGAFPSDNDLGFGGALGQLGFGDEAGESHSVCVFEIRVDRSHDDASFHGDEIDSDQG